MYIFVFKEFTQLDIFADIDIEVKQAEHYCKDSSEVLKTNIKLFYNQNDNVDIIIAQLLAKGCTLIDKNPSLIISNKKNGVTTYNKIYYNDRIILSYNN